MELGNGGALPMRLMVLIAARSKIDLPELLERTIFSILPSLLTVKDTVALP